LKAGHRHCVDKLVVDSKKGETKNYGIAESTKVSVCGKCAGSGDFMLHPAFTVGNRVVGVCEKTENHPLWRKLLDQCNDPSLPCGGEVVSQCEKYMGGYGEYSTQGNKKDLDGFDKMAKENREDELKRLKSKLTGFSGDEDEKANLQKELFETKVALKKFEQYQQDTKTSHPWDMFNTTYTSNRAIAFTCNRLFSYDFAAPVAQAYTDGDTGVHKCAGQIYRIVQAKFVACYSTNELQMPKQEMQCINRKQTKTCNTRIIQLPDYIPGTGKSAKSHADFCNEAFGPEVKEHAFNALTTSGVGEDWRSCSPLDEQTGTALG